MEKTEKPESSRKSVKPGKITTETPTTKTVAAKTSRTKTAKVKVPDEPIPPISPVLREELVATAAYFLAEKRGFVPGFELQDWLEAEGALKKLPSSRGRNG